MFKEFERLTEEPIKDKLQAGLDKYTDGILQLCKTSKQGLEMKNLILAAAAEEENADSKAGKLSPGPGWQWVCNTYLLMEMNLKWCTRNYL